MRNPNRIQPILDRLRKLWEAHPELRLGQLIGNVFDYSSKPDIYYFEDEEFIDKLTMPSGSLKNIEILDTKFKGEKIIILRFWIKEKK